MKYKWEEEFHRHQIIIWLSSIIIVLILAIIGIFIAEKTEQAKLQKTIQQHQSTIVSLETQVSNTKLLKEFL